MQAAIKKRALVCKHGFFNNLVVSDGSLNTTNGATYLSTAFTYL